MTNRWSGCYRIERFKTRTSFSSNRVFFKCGAAEVLGPQTDAD